MSNKLDQDISRTQDQSDFAIVCNLRICERQGRTGNPKSLELSILTCETLKFCWSWNTNALAK